VGGCWICAMPPPVEDTHFECKEHWKNVAKLEPFGIDASQVCETGLAMGPPIEMMLLMKGLAGKGKKGKGKGSTEKGKSKGGADKGYGRRADPGQLGRGDLRKDGLRQVPRPLVRTLQKDEA